MNIIIDGSNLLHRNFYVYKSSKSEGNDFNFYQFCLASIKKLKSNKEDKVYLVWDRKLSDKPNFRQVLLNGTYKGNRNREHADEIYSFLEGLKELTEAVGIKNIFPYSLEADDVIAFLSFNLQGKNRIVSTDKDLCQLVSKNTEIYSPVKQVTIDLMNFESRMGIALKHFVLQKSIMGDGSDNIPGIQGFGEVKSKKLAIKISENLDLLNTHEHKDLINKNIKLVSLHYSLKNSSEDIESFSEQLNTPVSYDYTKFKNACEKYGIKQYFQFSKAFKPEGQLGDFDINSIMEDVS